MKIDLESLDEATLGPKGKQILSRTHTEIEDWCLDYARDHKLKRAKVDRMLLELRIFFAAVTAAVHVGVFDPDQEPTQPPRALRNLWAEMSADLPLLDRFFKVTGLPEGYRYQEEYPSERCLTAGKMLALRTIIHYAGIRFTLKYW